MASETTAAAVGQVGVVRNDPLAMLPFCGYNMGDYFAHWLQNGRAYDDGQAARCSVNWFRTGDDGKFLWPGYGDNIHARAQVDHRSKARRGGEGSAVDSPVDCCRRQAPLIKRACRCQRARWISFCRWMSRRGDRETERNAQFWPFGRHTPAGTSSTSISS